MASKKGPTPVQTNSIREKLDQFYQFFFMANIFFMLALDLQEFIPASIKPEFAGAFRAWYLNTYNDQLFLNGPPFFHLYILIELCYTLPMNLWAVWALGKRHPLVPLHLMIFAAITTVTTCTCVVDLMEWTTVTAEEKSGLMWSYCGYLVPLVIMDVDMFMRIKEKLLA